MIRSTNILKFTYIEVSSRNFILEHNTEHISSQMLSKPPVLQNGDFQTLALELGVEVCVDRSAHPLQHQQPPGGPRARPVEDQPLPSDQPQRLWRGNFPQVLTCSEFC